MNEGTTITMGGKEWVIPALSLGQVRRLQPILEQIPIQADGVLTAETIDNSIAVIHAAMSRNYPDITLRDVEEMVDLRNIRPIFQAILGLSGLMPSGEVVAGTAK